jgi:hypothetical protein
VELPVSRRRVAPGDWIVVGSFVATPWEQLVVAATATVSGRWRRRSREMARWALQRPGAQMCRPPRLPWVAARDTSAAWCPVRVVHGRRSRVGDTMATLATQFKTALGQIEPKADAANAAEAHKRVTKALEADDTLKDLGVSTVFIGSYGRQVSNLAALLIMSSLLVVLVFAIPIAGRGRFMSPDRVAAGAFASVHRRTSGWCFCSANWPANRGSRTEAAVSRRPGVDRRARRTSAGRPRPRWARS